MEGIVVQCSSTIRVLRAIATSKAQRTIRRWLAAGITRILSGEGDKIRLGIRAAFEAVRPAYAC
jgi:hypothetical protein